jgi:hypothetical protein
MHSTRVSISSIVFFSLWNFSSIYLFLCFLDDLKYNKILDFLNFYCLDLHLTRYILFPWSLYFVEIVVIASRFLSFKFLTIFYRLSRLFYAKKGGKIKKDDNDFTYLGTILEERKNNTSLLLEQDRPEIRRILAYFWTFKGFNLAVNNRVLFEIKFDFKGFFTLSTLEVLRWLMDELMLST